MEPGGAVELGIRSAFSRLFSSAGYPATASAVAPRVRVPDQMSSVESEMHLPPADLGPGISGLAYEYYGSPWFGSAGDGSKFKYGLSSTGSTPIMDHTLLRLNSRSSYHDSMQVRSIVDRMADLIVGDGLRIESTPDAGALGMTEEEAEKWGESTANKFDAFMKSKRFSLSGDMTGYQSQRFTIVQQIRDGEYFARLHYNRSKSGENPLQVSYLDPIQIEGYPQTDTAGYYLTDSGIQYDKDGREVSYTVRVIDPVTREEKRVVLNRVGSRSGRQLVLHGYQREYAGQRRGLPKVGHILQDAELLSDFQLAHVKKAINESSIGGFIKPHKDHPASDGGLGDIASGAASPYSYADNPVTGSTSSDAPGLISTDYSELNEVNLRPGSLFVAGLQGGEDLKAFNGSTPAENYDSFVDSYMKSMCASVSMPHELVWMKFGDSFSASRAELVLAWHVVDIWQAEFASDYLLPIYEAWLSGEIAAGRISAPGWSDPRKRQAWLDCRWVGFPIPNIDPSKMADAEQKYVAMGATTLDRVARQYNGSSGKANRAKLAREFGELPQSPFSKNATSDPGQGGSKGPGRPVGS